MRYISSEIVQRSGYFQSSVIYIKVQIMFQYRKKKENVCQDKVLKQDNQFTKIYEAAKFY